jgi:hypothetical protein
MQVIIILIIVDQINNLDQLENDNKKKEIQIRSLLIKEKESAEIHERVTNYM